MWRLAVIALLVGAFGVNGDIDSEPQEPAEGAAKRCCTPKKWEGEVAETFGTHRPGRSGGGGVGGKLHVDVTNDRFMASTTTYMGHKKLQFDMYGNKTALWVVNREKKHCHKMRVPFHLRDCIPKSAISLGQRKYGESLVSDSWMMLFNDKRRKGEVTVSVSRQKCLPIFQVAAGQFGKVGMMKVAEFFNIKAGIKDPKVFDAPAFCRGAEEVDDPDRLEEIKSNMNAFYFELPSEE